MSTIHRVEFARPNRGYSPLQKASHWGLALLCVAEFPTAGGIQRGHLGHAFGIKPSTIDSLLATAHEWAGWLILVLGALLLFSRVFHGAPKLPHGMRFWQRALAYMGHSTIYLGLFALVASGAAAMYLSGRLAFVHIALSQIGVALISLHLVAVFWHQLVRRDDLLERLMPARRQIS
jgi:cytochrome b561